MKTDELREKYLAFFEGKGHRRVASDVLVPTWDPSVLFTPAGMNQFKDHFLGKVKLEYTRAATAQKCLRTGDIDNVGRTAYHHTFFEMLGNFSFGDYFKREAILWAWEFLTDKQWLGLDPARLSVTVYHDDDEAADIWADQVKLPAARIVREGESENFWPASAPSLGPDGVCGPCSEIYYHPPGPKGGSGQSVEIWNLVFTQFNRVGDPPDNLRPLPSKNIDTGMGLERTAATLQGVPTNYHIDILMPIVEAAAEVCGVKYDYASDTGRRLRRITDHVRACTFAVHENVYPGPNKEKYVVKRLLRRAVLDGHQLGLREPFLCKLVDKVAEMMAPAYPELKETVQRVAGVIEKEEANFFGTIDAGLNRIQRVFDEMRIENRTTVDGGAAAELYQTFGVPPELFEALAAEHNLAFDWPGYQGAMDEHGLASGGEQHTVMGAKGPIDSIKTAVHRSEFVGYEQTECEATVVGIVAGAPPNDHLCDQMEEVGHDNPVRVVLDRTPFYGESGGQVGDTGVIESKDFVFEVTDTQRDGDLIVHFGHLRRGVLVGGSSVVARVDATRRDAIRRAHSATHLLHYALRRRLGEHAQQQGSKVDADWLRFDFSHQSPVTDVELASIANDVTARVAAKAPVTSRTLPLVEARKLGAMMLFGEKYPDPVRMVSMGDDSKAVFSRELCGGVHLDSTADVGAFAVVSEEGVAAGTRRIVALTGRRAADYLSETESAADQAAERLRVPVSELSEAVKQLLSRQRALKKAIASGGVATETKMSGGDPEATVTLLDPSAKRSALAEAARALSVGHASVIERIDALLTEVATLEKQLAERDEAGPLNADALLEHAQTIAGVTVVVVETPGAPANLMRQLIDAVRQRVQPSAVLLAAAEGDKVVLVAGVSRDLEKRGLSAGKWIGPVAEVVGGGGGGRPDMAQAGGKHPEKLPEALAAARSVIAKMLG